MGNWRINPAFLGMDEMKRQKVEDLFDALNGRNLNEALPVITNWNLQLKQENIQFTNEENELLSEIFLQELPPEQMKQFELFKVIYEKVTTKIFVPGKNILYKYLPVSFYSVALMCKTGHFFWTWPVFILPIDKLPLLCYIYPQILICPQLEKIRNERQI